MHGNALSPFEITLRLIGQFSAHGGGVTHNIVQFVLAGSTWALLFAFALYRRRKKYITPHEDILILGFLFGMLRELFMLSIALLQSYGLVANEVLETFFPPIEHVLLDLCMVLVCGAYLRYLMKDRLLSGTYLRAGVSAVALCYLLTFWWWGTHVANDPTLKFGQTWCDWLFRINSSIFISIALLILLFHTKGWKRNSICLALFLLFLHEFLKIPDMILGEAYEAQITPFRHGFYLLGIPVLGYVYIREQIDLETGIEQALSQSEKIYRTLVENVDLGINLIDRNHTILMANKAQHEIFNKPPGFFVGKKCFKEFEHQDTICTHCPGVKAMETKNPQEAEVDNVRENGTVFKVRIMAFPVIDKDGEVESFIEVVEDITERSRIESELQQARNLESIGVLAGGIAHDFNNILAAIFGFTDLARLKLEKKDDVARELSQIRRASLRARDLVQQILTISRRQQQEKKPLQISLIVKEALKLMRSTFPSTIDIKQNIKSNSKVDADPTQIHQLIMNLCTNALQAMEETGGTMSVALDDMVIGSAESLFGDHVLAPGTYLRLEVSDTGPGIPVAIRDRIFEPYFTTKEVGKGTGLGLAVVMGIVKSHHGKINVYSEPEGGATFSVYMPVSESEEVVDEVIAHEEHFRAHGSERIMVVDDEKDIRDVMVSYLVNFGYTVDVYENGKEAWDAFAREPDKWNIVITDQTMPGMTGMELIPRVREKHPNLPVILCTGYSKLLNQQKINELGVNAYLKKPSTMGEILKAVRNSLDTPETTAG